MLPRKLSFFLSTFFCACLIFAQATHAAETAFILKKTEPEIHDFTGLPLDENGWTNFAYMVYQQNLYADARVVFVSSSEGDDATGTVYDISAVTFDAFGIFQPAIPIKPFKTITAAYSKIRDGFPDILLLKRGDEWLERFTPSSIGRVKSGKDALARHIIASYGDSGQRPTIKTGTDDGFDAYGSSNVIIAGIKSFQHLWETVTATKDGGSGVTISGGGGKNILFEDCYFERHRSSTIQGSSTVHLNNVVLRRCIFQDSGAWDGHLFASKVDNLLLEENMFYNPHGNAWTETGRHLYLSPGDQLENTPKDPFATLRRNIFYRSGRGGIHARCGGTIDNNLIVANDQLLFGGHGGSEDSIQGGSITNNVFLESWPEGAGAGEYSLILQNNDGTEVANNIWTDPTGLSRYAQTIMLKGDENVNIARNISIHDNIVYNRSGGGTNYAISTGAEFTEVSNVIISNNIFQSTNNAPMIIHRPYAGGSMIFEGYTYSGNIYYTTLDTRKWFRIASYATYEDWVAQSGEVGSSVKQVLFPDPERNLRTYNQAIGGTPSSDDFMLAALKQSRFHWDKKYTACEVNNYIRAGFAKDPVPCRFH